MTRCGSSTVPSRHDEVWQSSTVPSRHGESREVSQSNAVPSFAYPEKVYDYAATDWLSGLLRRCAPRNDKVWQ